MNKIVVVSLRPMKREALPVSIEDCPNPEHLRAYITHAILVRRST